MSDYDDLSDEEVRENAKELFTLLNEMENAIGILRPKVCQVIDGEIELEEYDDWVDENWDELKALDI